MPIYEYRCDACGARLEKLQKISDAPLSECPACSKPALSKLVSATSFRLKGSGWYETDFKTGKKKNGVADSAGDTAGDTTAGNSKSDASPAPAGESNKIAGTTAAGNSPAP